MTKKSYYAVFTTKKPCPFFVTDLRKTVKDSETMYSATDVKQNVRRNWYEDQVLCILPALSAPTFT